MRSVIVYSSGGYRDNGEHSCHVCRIPEGYKRALTDLQGQTVGMEIANVFTCFTNPVNTSEINPQSEKAT